MRPDSSTTGVGRWAYCRAQGRPPVGAYTWPSFRQRNGWSLRIGRHLAVGPRAHLRRLAGRTLDDRVRRHVLGHHGPGPEQAIGPNGHVVPERRVHTEKAVRPDVAEPGHHHVRRDEAVVADLRVVSDV